jgi:hypothetical protein
MSKYAEALRKNLPRMQVTYTQGETRDKDIYAWGIHTGIPTDQLIGYIVRIQAELSFRNPDKADDCALVIFFDPATRKMSWFVDPIIPIDVLVGTLELIKTILIDTKIGQMAAQSATGLIGIDGKPITRRA